MVGTVFAEGEGDERICLSEVRREERKQGEGRGSYQCIKGSGRGGVLSPIKFLCILTICYKSWLTLVLGVIGITCLLVLWLVRMISLS